MATELKIVSLSTIFVAVYSDGIICGVTLGIPYLCIPIIPCISLYVTPLLPTPNVNSGGSAVTLTFLPFTSLFY